MPVQSQAVGLAKAGNTAEEYEDAFRVRRSGGKGTVVRAAVADGATETSFSGLWAAQLTDAYARGRLTPERWDTTLNGLREDWWREVSSRPLPWYAEEKVRQGAFAALCGLTVVRHPTGYHWRALALGDCALLHLRAGRLLRAFPLEHAAAFNSRPALLGSRGGEAPPRARAEGAAEPGDRFLLVTDALAVTLLRAEEGGDPLWEALPDPGSEDFSVWVETQRAAGTMRNDDVTAVLLRIE